MQYKKTDFIISFENTKKHDEAAISKQVSVNRNPIGARIPESIQLREYQEEAITAWINNNELPIVNDESFTYFGGIIPGIPIPVPFFIAAICVLIIFLVLKFTTLGLYTQAVGINERAAKLNGLNPVVIKILTFVILGVCVAVCGFIKVSRTSSITYSVIANNIEMDAILAVALGGNNLGGGKFNLTASVIGAYVIQFLTTTLYKFKEIDSSSISAYKAVVVILLIIISSPFVRKLFEDLKNKREAAKAEALAGKETN